MVKLPKRMQKSHANVDRVKFYPVDEAVKLIKERAIAKFDETDRKSVV